MKRSHDVEIQEEVDFSSLVQNKTLLKGLTESGYEKPSPIQLEAIPMGRLGVDLIAQAKSGTGKTVVFGVIAIESIAVHIRAPQAILIAPTREIAVQIKDVITNLGRFINGFKCEAFIGGLSVQADLERLKHCQVIVGTPGRLMSLLDEKRINTTYIKLLVLDEADKLMSDVFKPQVEFIFKKLTLTKQCIAFSATFTDELLNSLFTFMKDPQTIRLTQGVPTLHESTDTVSVYRAKFEAVANLLGKVPFYQCMLFVNSLPRSIELAQWLTESGWKSGYISAGISQEKRLEVMEEMRDFKIRILVCSDLIARGIDIDRVNFVVNLDFPWDVETYLHRIGRTGRYGNKKVFFFIFFFFFKTDFQNSKRYFGYCS
ncbi:DEAD-domain-containing protein [Backusella circina FSU 941]|nr:DEAD-domain-containing protein [Backusella circina FSU 941]